MRRRAFAAALAASLAAHAATFALWPPRPLPIGVPAPLTVALVSGDTPAPAGKGVVTSAAPSQAPQRAAAPARRSGDLAAREPARRAPGQGDRAAPSRAVPVAPVTREAGAVGGGNAAASPSGSEAGRSPAPVAGGAPSAGGGADEAPLTPARYRADYLSNPPPAYPERSRELGEEGRVEVRVRVSPDGRAAEVLLHRSSGFRRLDDAALRAVAGWRFVPARRGDTPVEAWLIVPMPFRLEAPR
ncbi:outer membrane transport energization protein TonB [Crenobacter luteus]|uniref:energy transducer TonB n=1 Tax=Crenobacter luteus TaxID=1452487 RepID=UPI001050DE0D|nr:energy transducer TonB [Crenobacter luteus]TCP14782.1 outer membrane transport energization protein TonB [Crenobacter luteus]